MNEITTRISEASATEVVTSPMMQIIEKALVSDDVDFAKLETFMKMQERLEDRQAKKAFDLAISAAKADIKPIVKTGSVSYGKGKTEFKHETLDGIARAVDPILSANGLSYRFRSDQLDGGIIRVTCIVSHRDGHSEETSLQGSRDDSGSKNNYQAVGSAVTYLQRYTLKLALGLSAANDDDAGAAGEAEKISEEQYRELNEMVSNVLGKNDAAFLNYMGVKQLVDLPASKFSSAKEALENKKAQGAA